MKIINLSHIVQFVKMVYLNFRLDNPKKKKWKWWLINRSYGTGT